jgi:hypothetical protein
MPLKYNLQEQKLAEEKYNDHYLKAMEDFKTKNSYAIEPPKGEASWTNPEWLEFQALQQQDLKVHWSFFDTNDIRIRIS